MSTPKEVWDHLSHALRDALISHVENDMRRWRNSVLGFPALEEGLIEKAEHPKYMITDFGWEVGLYGLSLPKGPRHVEVIDLSCSFCGKSKQDGVRVVSGPAVYICNECVVLCQEILDQEKLELKARIGG